MKTMMMRFVGLAVLGVAAMAVTPASAQISTTPHNLNSISPDPAGDNGEVCVYCHTPHGANTAVTAPLWNKLSASLSFQTYDSTTMDSQLAVGGVGSVSIACLTCHEGTQAMDVVINAPGTGSYDPVAGVDMNPAASNTLISRFSATDIRVIGGDLRNDHPISIQYAGFGTPKIDPDFTAPSTSGSGATQRWWVNTTGGTANRDKTDMILYTRAAAGGGAGVEPFVECASCHDPHIANPTFLRIQNTGSAVCLACHTK